MWPYCVTLFIFLPQMCGHSFIVRQGKHATQIATSNRCCSDCMCLTGLPSTPHPVNSLLSQPCPSLLPPHHPPQNFWFIKFVPPAPAATGGGVRNPGTHSPGRGKKGRVRAGGGAWISRPQRKRMVAKVSLFERETSSSLVLADVLV